MDVIYQLQLINNIKLVNFYDNLGHTVCNFNAKLIGISFLIVIAIYLLYVKNTKECLKINKNFVYIQLR